MSTPKPRPLPVLDADVQALTDLTLAVFRVNGALLQWGDALVGPLGLTSARWQMLGAIALAGRPLTAPQVGDAMGVSRQGAQKQLNLLMEQGLVESHANPAHRRSPLHGLTPHGRRLYLRAQALWTARAAELAAYVSVPGARAAAAALDTMLARLVPDRDPKEQRP
jgi:DNA-binding MarR family transcriptional regulator